MEELKALLGPFVGMRIKTNFGGVFNSGEMLSGTITKVYVFKTNHELIIEFRYDDTGGGTRSLSMLNKTWWYI